MKFSKKIFSQIFSLMLMVHLLAVNVQFDFYLKFINPSEISKDIDFEKEAESKSKKAESDSFDSEIDDFFYNLAQNKNNSGLNTVNENTQKNGFHFAQFACPIAHFEIQIPPPRA